MECGTEAVHSWSEAAGAQALQSGMPSVPECAVGPSAGLGFLPHHRAHSDSGWTWGTEGSDVADQPCGSGS